MTVTGDAQAGPDTGSGSGKAEPWAASLARVDLGEIPYNEATEAMWPAGSRSGGPGRPATGCSCSATHR